MFQIEISDERKIVNFRGSLFIIIVLGSVVTICVAETSTTSSNFSIQTNQSNEPESLIRQQEIEYTKRNKAVRVMERSVENWITLACLALTIITATALLIIIIHLKSRRKSNLLHLYA